MLDLQGRAAGVPVYKLLGGAVRRERGIWRLSLRLPYLETDGISERDVPAGDGGARGGSAQVARTGAKLFEFKIGRFSVATDIESIRAVRSALGEDVVLGVDSNQALSIGRYPPSAGRGRGRAARLVRGACRLIEPR